MIWSETEACLFVNIRAVVLVVQGSVSRIIPSRQLWVVYPKKRDSTSVTRVHSTKTAVYGTHLRGGFTDKVGLG